LGDGDDVLVISAGEGDGVPRRYATDLRGESGADVIRGGRANDRIFGEQGRDTVAGWSGNDFLSGGPGADGVIGFGGNDTLLGGSGRDALFGQKGHDRMFGGPQNDVLLARDGLRDPVLDCGPGRLQSAIVDQHDPPSSNCRSPK
jgi:Ca2+-binding RTX toxin-like protein